MLDREKLGKLLAMTTSTHDAEALAAIRLACAMVARAGMTWDDVLVQVPPGLRVTISRGMEPYVAEEAWPAPRPKRPGAA